MNDDTLVWIDRGFGWHVAESKARPGAVYHVMPCADGYQLHLRRCWRCYVWGDVFAMPVEAKQAAQAWEGRTPATTSELQPAAAGSVAS